MDANVSYGKNLLETALDWIDAGREIAFATIISARGSSPFPVGSQLLIDEDGNFEGSVSGGCIEGVVVAEGMEVIAHGKPRRPFFSVTRDPVWDVGLACGGEVELFVEPATTQRDLIAGLVSSRNSRQAVCLVTNLASGGKFLVDADTLSEVLPQALQHTVEDALASGESKIYSVGAASFFLHVFLPKSELLIIGAVHIAQPLSLMARAAGYTVTIIDSRETFATPERFPDVKLVNVPPKEVLTQWPLHSRCAVAALSHEPKLDDPALMIALKSPAFYVGALGSRKTNAKRVERLLQAGLTQKETDRLHAPIGLDIGAYTASEIAVAVLAEMTQGFRAGK